VFFIFISKLARHTNEVCLLAKMNILYLIKLYTKHIFSGKCDVNVTLYMRKKKFSIEN